VSLYAEKCHSFCGSKLCPDLTPYFKLDGVNECVADCPNGFTEDGDLCVPTKLCHSTCGTCSIKGDPTKCSTCSSTFSSSFAYNTLTPPGSCTLPVANNAQLLMTVNKDTVLGTSPLKNITYNTSVTHSTSGTALSALPSLFILNVIDFFTLSSNTVTFDFSFPDVHRKLIVRARVLSECDTNDGEDTTVQMTLSGSPNQVANLTLAPNIDTVLEGQIAHSTATFTVTIAFGTHGQPCRRILQDISIYYEKCSSHCLSKNCPNDLPHYKLSSGNTCVNSCPYGFVVEGNYCITTKFCHSTCGTCSVRNDQTQCQTCTSTLPSLAYAAFPAGQTVGQCSMTSSNNAQYLLTIDKNTPIGTSLTSV
jgi:hypothetical protein